MHTNELFHKGFQNRVTNSNAANAPKAVFSRWLEERYFEVYSPPSTLAPTHAEANNHKDKGDIFCRHRGLGPFAGWHRVEVKGVSLRRGILRPGKWRWDPTFIVRKGYHDEADPKPVLYVIISENVQDAALCLVQYSEFWSWEETPDFERPGYTQLTYCCPTYFLDFFDLRTPGLPHQLIRPMLRGPLLLAGDPKLRPPGYKTPSRLPPAEDF